MVRDLGSNEGLEAEAILYVLQGFQAAQLGQEIHQPPKPVLSSAAWKVSKEVSLREALTAKPFFLLLQVYPAVARL